MSITISNSGSTISTMFSNLSTNNKDSNNGTSNFLGINYTDYSSIKSGSYYKLLKAYYKKEDAGTLSTSTSKDATSKLTTIQSKADSLGDAADKLLATGSKSVFNKKTITNEDGTSTTDYDKDAIYKAVQSFVDNYNSLISSSKSSETTGIAVTSASMVNQTNQNANLLGSIGISVNSSDYTLSVDEQAFKEADMTTVKSVFNGNGSYAYQVAVKASMMDYYAQNEASKSNTYTHSGSYSYNYSAGSLVDSIT